VSLRGLLRVLLLRNLLPGARSRVLRLAVATDGLVRVAPALRRLLLRLWLLGHLTSLRLRAVALLGHGLRGRLRLVHRARVGRRGLRVLCRGLRHELRHGLVRVVLRCRVSRPVRLLRLRPGLSLRTELLTGEHRLRAVALLGHGLRGRLRLGLRLLGLLLPLRLRGRLLPLRLTLTLRLLCRSLRAAALLLRGDLASGTLVGGPGAPPSHASLSAGCRGLLLALWLWLLRRLLLLRRLGRGVASALRLRVLRLVVHVPSLVSKSRDDVA